MNDVIPPYPQRNHDDSESTFAKLGPLLKTRLDFILFRTFFELNYLFIVFEMSKCSEIELVEIE